VCRELLSEAAVRTEIQSIGSWYRETDIIQTWPVSSALGSSESYAFSGWMLNEARISLIRSIANSSVLKLSTCNSQSLLLANFCVT